MLSSQAVAETGKPLPAIMVFQPVVRSTSSSKSAEDILGLYDNICDRRFIERSVRGNYCVDGGMKIRIRDAHSVGEAYFFRAISG